MKKVKKKNLVITLTDESFKQYMLLRYVSNSSDPKWKDLELMSEETISSTTWIELYNLASLELKKNGGAIIGYELVNGTFKSREAAKQKSWPSNWMWVIQSNVVQP